MVEKEKLTLDNGMFFTDVPQQSMIHLLCNVDGTHIKEYISVYVSLKNTKCLALKITTRLSMAKLLGSTAYLKFWKFLLF